GSVLLEHLAAAARERGISTFTAEVLPQNVRMINVFTDAGFDVERTLDDGVVLVSFRIDPTARSLAVMAEREHRAEARAMERLLNPSSVLLVGVSSRVDSAGGRFLTALERSGFEGGIHLVSRDVFEIRGHAAHAHIRDVPGPVDLAVIALSPESCFEAIEECAQVGISSVLIPTEGFSDSEDGRSLQRELVAWARLHGMRLLGPGSFGFFRTGADPLHISLAPKLPRPGPVALAGQSSALSAMLLSGADSRGTGIHEFVGVGNRADVSLNDTLQHWEDDERVGVIALALESMGNPRKFTRIAKRLTRRTPLIVLRPPGTDTSAPPGHDVRTTTLPRRAMDQVLDSAGVVQAGGVDHLMDIVDAIGRQGVAHGPRVRLLSHTAALGAALRGAADRSGRGPGRGGAGGGRPPPGGHRGGHRAPGGAARPPGRAAVQPRGPGRRSAGRRRSDRYAGRGGRPQRPAGSRSPADPARLHLHGRPRSRRSRAGGHARSADRRPGRGDQADGGGGPALRGEPAGVPAHQRGAYGRGAPSGPRGPLPAARARHPLRDGPDGLGHAAGRAAALGG